MGLFDSVADTAKGLMNGGLSSLFKGLGGGLAGTIYGVPEALDGSGIPWTFSGFDWHKIYPYSFVVKATQSSFGNNEFTYTLPIPPTSMVTKMIPASKATSTLGGVVEETSENVFWTIQMAGTMGIGISRNASGETESAPVHAARADVAKRFRQTIQTTGLLSGIAASTNKIIGKVGGVVDSVIGAAGALASGNIAGAIGGIVAGANNIYLPSMPYAGSGVDSTTNGFTEMQELHRFLYTYSKIKAKNAKGYELWFKNYKTGQQWRVVLKDFTIQKSAQNPMLERYNIVLQAWNVQPIDANDKKKKEVDRFAAGGDLASVNTVGDAAAKAIYEGRRDRYTQNLASNSKNSTKSLV